MLIAAPIPATRHAASRSRAIDNLKTVLVAGVIVGHTTMAWTGLGDWVFFEPPVREPLLTVLVLAEVVAALFAIPLFFFVAGLFTPRSFERKGPGRFLRGRLVRLGLPMLFYVVFLSPPVEYVDPGWQGWERGFWAFLPEVWWPPAPGPTWFLGVLLVFSAGYAAIRTVRPRRDAPPGTPRRRTLVVAVLAMAAAAYVIRIWVPLGVEFGRLALGQAPSWTLGFGLGAIAAERGWLDPLQPRVARIARRSAWSVAAGIVTLIMVLVAFTGAEMEPFAGGGAALSLVVALLEGVLIVSMAFWLIDLFRRRFGRQRRIAQAMSRAAFAAYVLHQLVLVGLVLGSRLIDLPPEVEYLAVSVLGVSISFGSGWLVLRIPAVSRVV